MNLWHRSLADRDSLGVSLPGLCAARSSGQQAPGRYTWPPRFLLLFSFFLLVLWAGDSSLLAQDSGRAEYKAGKVWRVGVLVTANLRLYDSFVDELRRLGYVDGQNIVLEFRNAEGKYERFPVLAAELVRAGVDVRPRR